MIDLSYTISPRLRESLLQTEQLKRKILLPPLSLDSEIQLRFGATIDRIFYTLHPNGYTKDRLSHFLLLQTPGNQQKRNRRSEEDILAFKRGLDYIYQNWQVNPKPCTPRIAGKLQSVAFGGKLKVTQESLLDLFTYLQAQGESPIIQAAICFSQIVRYEPFTKENRLMAHLLSLLYLYKSGYDFRSMVVVEEEAAKEEGVFRHMLKDASTRDNLTLWIEYFAELMARHLETIVNRIAEKRLADGWHTEVPIADDDLTIEQHLDEQVIALNDRQRHILTVLDVPLARITNRNVQELFSISQITASRDLTKLASLGLVIPHGKGRAIFYTKI